MNHLFSLHETERPLRFEHGQLKPDTYYKIESQPLTNKRVQVIRPYL